MTDLYKDPILEKLFALISASNTDIISYHYGDPLFIPKSELPALIGSTDITSIGDLGNAEDEHRIKYFLTLVTDIREWTGIANPDNIHVGDQIGKKIVEERNANYTLKSSSLLDILRSNEDLGNNAHIDTENPVIADYGFTFGKRGENNWAWEVNIEVPVYFSQLR